MVEQYLPYAGIGSREAPQEVLSSIKALAVTLAEMGFVLRSGGADGADRAFEEGASMVGGAKEIFLPWKSFNANKSGLFEVSEAAKEVAKKYHPSWVNLKDPVKLLHARNAYQVLGNTLANHSLFVVCWTPDAIESGLKRTSRTGGTGQAIAIATDFNVPVFNLANPNAMMRILDYAEACVGLGKRYSNGC